LKKIIYLFLILLVVVGVGIGTTEARKPEKANRKGFDEYGFNYNARLFNGWLGHYDRVVDGGWLPGTQDSWLVMKWSRDWNPMEDSPVGAWISNHFTWYSNDFEIGTRFGWLSRVKWNESVPPDAKYRIKEAAKIMRVGDNPEKWSEYSKGGAYPAGEVYPFLTGRYDSGVPKYVVFQDTIEVYDTNTNRMVFEYDLCSTSPKGLGKPIF
jgi:hypothetical protein